jgi:hypothetical protein
MKNTVKILGIIALATVIGFSMTACGEYTGSDYNTFDYKLRGTWQSNDPSIYSGSLIIDYNHITILGYNESQTPLLGDDTQRPFRSFIKKIPLKGYSEEGKIFIEEGGSREGIPYTHQELSSGRVKLLYFTFGNRPEIMEKVSDEY